MGYFKVFTLALSIQLISTSTYAQISNSGISDSYDSLENGKISIEGMVDTYYGFDFNRSNSKDRSYAVSSARNNEFNVNLAYLDIKYKNNRVRAHLVPGFGTYMNANYENEKGTLRNLVEANVGIKLSNKKEIWLDAGILGSPYTNESAISKDHLMYTRTFAAENVPYYLSGAKISMTVNSKLNIYGYLINGWQQISDNNRFLSFGSQVEYRPNKKVLINWDTYIGNESSIYSTNYRIRYFTDIYLIYKPNDKWSFTSCGYIGNQRIALINNPHSNRYWGQANFTVARYTEKNAFISARVEYFSDQQAVVVQPIYSEYKFSAASASLAYNLKISSHALFRIENRYFYSPEKIFQSKTGPRKTENLLIANITVWF